MSSRNNIERNVRFHCALELSTYKLSFSSKLLEVLHG
jgi:hypothetical protein